MNARKWAIGALGAGISTLVATASAWACVSGPSATLNPTKAGPGDAVTITMRDFRKADPIELRWNDLNAPVMATFESSGSGAPITGQITVPADAKPGNYLVILSQKAPDGKVSQMPVRALFTVSGPNGATPVVGAATAPVDESRPTGLVTEDNSVSGGTLALVALGVAGLGMFVAGMAALFAGRRGPAPRAAAVRN
ncbi:MAG: hypothetical protein ACLGI2_01760 [Acidimicrobiia bacterium]